MIEKDPIEELFRTEMEVISSDEKPRAVVWQKIEKELRPKHQKPLKEWVNNIWCAVGVFALIAIPYFYFLIENMTSEEKIKLTDQPTKGEEYTYQKRNFHSDSLAPEKIVDKSTDVLKTQPIKVLKTETTLKLKDSTYFSDENWMIENEIIFNEKTDRVKIDSSVDYTENMMVEPQQTTEDKSNVLPDKKEDKSVLFYKNRLIVQDKINHVSFVLLENKGNKLTFERNGKFIYLKKKNEEIIVSTNSDRMKKELLNIVILNKEKIFNYYINSPKS